MKTEAGWPRGCALMSCPYWDNEKGYCTSEGVCIYNDQGCEESAMVADGLRSRIKELESIVSGMYSHGEAQKQRHDTN